MSETTKPRTTVTSHATAEMRLKPCLLLMLFRVRVAEATLELGLANVKNRSEDITRRLTRLGAIRVEPSVPHEDEGAELDPSARLRSSTMARLRRQGGSPLPDRRGVNVILTATWDITDNTPEETMLLIDRLRFDAAADIEQPLEPPEPSPSAGPEEKMRAMMELATAPPPDDRSPKFLYIVRPTEEQLAEATARAHRLATQASKRLATAAGRQLGELTSLHYGYSGSDSRMDRVLDKQRCSALLAVSNYQLGDWEMITDDPRTVALTISLNLSHYLE